MGTDGLTFLVWPLLLVLVGVALVLANQPPSAGDLSSHGHRQLIGYTGLALPVALPFIAKSRPIEGLDWSALDSVSSYYYTGGVALFVGALVALAAFLFTYRGYDNKYGFYDRIAGFVAATAALGVAFFPTGAPSAALRSSWWSEQTGRIHHGSALVLFVTFACFAFFLFPMTDPAAPRPRALPGDKRARNALYYLCGAVIVVCLIIAGFALRAGKSIYWAESGALIAFAVSWLVKGRFEQTATSIAASTWRLARNPQQILRKMRPPG